MASIKGNNIGKHPKKLERLIGGMLLVRKKTTTYLVVPAELGLMHTWGGELMPYWRYLIGSASF